MNFGGNLSRCILSTKPKRVLRLEAAREVRLPLGPVSLALLSSPPFPSFPSFVGPRIVRERDGRIRNLWVPFAIVAHERCPCPASQDLVELDPRSLQLAQPPRRSCYPLVLDGLSTSLCSVAGLPLLLLLKRPLVLRPRLTAGLPLSQRSKMPLRTSAIVSTRLSFVKSYYEKQ